MNKKSYYHYRDELKSKFIKDIAMKIKYDATTNEMNKLSYSLAVCEDSLYYKETGKFDISYFIDFTKNTILLNKENFPIDSFHILFPSILRAGNDLLEKIATLEFLPTERKNELAPVW